MSHRPILAQNSVFDGGPIPAHRRPIRPPPGSRPERSRAIRRAVSPDDAHSATKRNNGAGAFRAPVDWFPHLTRPRANRPPRATRPSPNVPLERTPRLNPTHADFQSVPASVPPTFAATRAPTAAAPARAAGASPATSSTPPRRATTPSPSPSPRSPTTRSPSRTSRLPRLRRRLPSTPPWPRAPPPRRLTPPPSPP